MENAFTETQEQNRLNALLSLPEFSFRVMWEKVVERGRGLNFKVHGVHTSWKSPMQVLPHLNNQPVLPGLT